MNLINRDELVSALKKIPLHDLSEGKNLCVVIFKEDLESAIRGLANAVVLDAVPVVRCKDCKMSHDADNTVMRDKVITCGLYASKPIMRFDDFCSYGERRTP